MRLTKKYYIKCKQLFLVLGWLYFKTTLFVREKKSENSGFHYSVKTSVLQTHRYHLQQVIHLHSVPWENRTEVGISVTSFST